jgi:hypothetical protein
MGESLPIGQEKILEFFAISPYQTLPRKRNEAICIAYQEVEG